MANTFDDANQERYANGNNAVDNTRNGAIRQRIIEQYPNIGTLRVQVSTGRGSFPVKGALVEVALNYDGKHYVIYRNQTNESGIVSDLLLPANPTAESQSSATAGGSGVDYLVSVTHPSFADQNDLYATIYNKVGSILNVDLVPVLRNGEVR